MSRRPPLMLLLASSGIICVTMLAAAPQPGSQPERAGAQQGDTAGRDRMRERLNRILADLRADQTKVEQAISRLDAGASIDELRAGLPDAIGARLRFGPDAPPDADRGPRRGDRSGPGRPGSDQPFTEDDWAAVDAIIQHAQPDMLEKFKELRQQDPEQAQRRTLAAYPRLRPLLELYRHDRTAFDLRLDEMTYIRKSLPVAKQIVELRRQGKAEDSEEMESARAQLRDLAAQQTENRLALQRHELDGMRRRLERREKDLAEQVGNPERAIERTMEGLIRQAERGEAFDRRGGGPEGGADRPRRRGADRTDD